MTLHDYDPYDHPLFREDDEDDQKESTSDD